MILDPSFLQYKLLQIVPNYSVQSAAAIGVTWFFLAKIIQYLQIILSPIRIN